MSLLAKKPRLPKDYRKIQRGEKVLFLDPISPNWVVVTKKAAAILQLCNGKRTIEEISNSLSTFTNNTSKNQITGFLEEIFTQTDFFEPKNTTNPTYQKQSLHIVQLSLTSKCNLKCIYCYATDRQATTNSFSKAEHFNLIDSINNLSKNADIVLTGGEPLLVSYAIELAEYAKKKGNSPQLLTNGTLVNKENAKIISNLFDLTKISIDGSNSQVHDFHRGQNSFIKSLKAFELLQSHSAPVMVSMTVTKRNINEIGAMVKLFGSHLSFAPLFRAGRAKDKKDLFITGEEYYNALASVEGVRPLSDLCSSLSSAKNKRIMKCAMGDGEISISEAGDVFPCQLLHFPEFKAGNIREQSLQSIYENSEVLEFCRNLSVLNIKGCKKCDIRFICGGACRARTYYEKKRLDVSGEFCKYEKRAFINGLFDLHDL